MKITYFLGKKVSPLYPTILFNRGLFGWNGLSFNGLPLITKTFFKSSLVDNVDEFYYSYELDDKSIITRLTLDELRIYAPAVEQNNQEVGYCVSTAG